MVYFDMRISTKDYSSISKNLGELFLASDAEFCERHLYQQFSVRATFPEIFAKKRNLFFLRKHNSGPCG